MGGYPGRQKDGANSVTDRQMVAVIKGSITKCGALDCFLQPTKEHYVMAHRFAGTPWTDE